ncbi:MAG: S8 family serine peptidase [Lactobacillales bacterium]|jgi:LPXTG-motif cell wall-anchored protein|nr:S8 family serine peptidase [Lactobacillales bacterium]
MKLRNKATVMLGVLTASAAMNLALALPAITYAAQNDSAQTNTFEQMKKAFEAQHQAELDSLAGVDSSKLAKKKIKDTVVDIVVELDSAPAIKHIKKRPDGSKKSLKEIKEKSDSVIAKHVKWRDKVKDITGDSLDSSKDKDFGYLVNAFTTKAKLSELDSIANIPGVKSVGQVNTYTTQDANSNTLDQVQEAWNGVSIPGLKLHGEGMVIAIVDTGIDWLHNDLKHNPDSARLSESDVDKLVKDKDLPGKYYSAKVPYGYNYADQDFDVKDTEYNSQHGMHVAGIAGADGTDYLKDSARDSLTAAHKVIDQAAEDSINKITADNQTHVDGAAPQAQLLAMKVFSNVRGHGESCETPAVIAAVEDAVKLGADVINMSLGADNGETGTDIEDIALGRAADAGVLPVVAAGNAGDYNSPITTSQYLKGNGKGTSKLTQTVGAPSVNPYVLSVAASQNVSKSASGLDIYGEGNEKEKFFDSLGGTLVGTFSDALYPYGRLVNFPDSDFNIVTLKDNHTGYWESMRTELDQNVINGLKSQGIEMISGNHYDLAKFEASGVKSISLKDSEEDVPAVGYSALDNALSTRGLDTMTFDDGQFSEKYGGAKDNYNYNPDSFNFGQGFQTDLKGYTGNWHDPLDSSSGVDSSAHPGTDIEGKVVIVPLVKYDVFVGGVNPNAQLYENLKAAGAKAIIYVAPKSQNPTNVGDYIAFAKNKDAYSFSLDLPAIVIPANDGEKLVENINDKNEESLKTKGKLPEYHFKNTSVNITNVKAGKMAEYSSYGPTDELELKPEITAVGSDVWSLANENSYKFNSGTSMATPQTAGISALLLQYLKTLDNKKTGKDLLKQSKNLLMNSATPIFESPFSVDYMDVDTENYAFTLADDAKLNFDKIDLPSDYDHEDAAAASSFKSQEVLVSPRRQGAGEVNASKALSTTTSLLDAADGDVSLALKEIGAHTNFKVKLTNFGTTTKTYQLDSKYDHVYSQAEIKDDTYGDFDIDRQIDFPLKKDVASLTLTDKDGKTLGYTAEDSITLAPGQTFEINGSLDLNDTSFQENWLEGYVGVKEVGSTETAVIPYFGYTGHVDDNPIFDKFSGEQGCIGQMMQFLTTSVNRPGNNNTWLGKDVDSWRNDYFDENKVAFSPRNKDNIILLYTVLRNNSALEFNILDSDKNLLRTLKKTAHESPNTMRSDQPHVNIDAQLKWDGTVWNKETGNYDSMPEGKYYYQFKGTGSRAGDTEQSREVPIVIDNTKPVVSDVSIAKDADGDYAVTFTVTENGSGFVDETTVGIAINGDNAILGNDRDVVGSGFLGTKTVTKKIPASLVPRIAEGVNEVSIGVADAADNQEIFYDVINVGDAASGSQSFRLTRPYFSGGEDSYFIAMSPRDDLQVDTAHKLVHVKGFSDSPFYINKETKITPAADNSFDSWVSYASSEVHSQVSKMEIQPGDIRDFTFDYVRDLKFSHDAEGSDQFKVVSFATDPLASDGKPIFTPPALWGDDFLFTEGGARADHSLASEELRLEIDRLEADGEYAHDSIVRRAKEPIWVLDASGEVVIDPTQTRELEDSAGERAIARIDDAHKDDHFAIINLSAGEYYSDGKVYSKGGTDLPEQVFTADQSNDNAFTTKFNAAVGANVVEIKDIDNPDYSNFTFVYANMAQNGLHINSFDGFRYVQNVDGAEVIGYGAVKAGDYKVTDPVTGNGTFHMWGSIYDGISNLHYLTTDDRTPTDENKVIESPRNSVTGEIKWDYDVKVKNNAENVLTTTWHDDKLPEPMQTGIAKFQIDVTPPTLELGDKFKHVADAPAGDADVFDNIKDLGNYTINSTDGKLDLAGVFGDNQWDFALRINGNQVYRSEHENQDGPWPGEIIDFKDVDYRSALELTPGVDNYYVIDVTDLVGNVTRAHILVTQNSDPAVTPGDDSSSDSQDLGDSADSEDSSDSVDSADSTDSKVPTDSAGPSDNGALPASVLSYDELSDDNRGGVSIAEGQTGELRIDIDNTNVNVGDVVTAYIYSDPTLLGAYTVQEDSNGKYITVIVPDTFTGDHKIALYNAAGDLVGWAPVTLASSGAAEPSDLPTKGIHLPQTGEEAATWVAYAGIIVIAIGGSFVFLRRRKI